MGRRNEKRDVGRDLCRLINVRQSEVRWAIAVSALIEAALGIVSFHENFAMYQDNAFSLIECVIAGLISMIGVAIAGIAILIALFTTEQIKTINDLVPNAFNDLLYDFKWLALVATIEIAVFVVTFFVIGSSFPLAPKVLFYLIIFLLVYGVFYLLFYGVSLVGNFIKMAQIKSSLEMADMLAKSTSVLAVETQIDFLVSKFMRGDKELSQRYYNELIEIIKGSSLRDKETLVKYLEERYIGKHTATTDCKTKGD